MVQVTKEDLQKNPFWKLGVQQGILYALSEAQKLKKPLPTVAEAYVADWEANDITAYHLPSPTEKKPKKQAKKKKGEG